MTAQQKSLEEETRLLLDDPAMVTDFSVEAWDQMGTEEVDAMQLAGLQRRFKALRDTIPTVKKLADAENIDVIDSINDVVPLLFEHTVFKSYPPSLLENNRFTQLNKWLSKLTTYDLEAVDVSACQCLDDYFDVMEEALPQLCISYTSGTSGSLSLLPHSRLEFDKNARMKCLSQRIQTSPGEPPAQVHVAYPFFRSGRMAHLRSHDSIVKYMLKGEEFFHAAYPGRMSADVHYLAARMRAAQARGTLDRLKVNPAILDKKKEFDRLQEKMPQHLEHFFADIADKLRGQRIYVWSTWNLLHNMAKAGLSRLQQIPFRWY